MSRSSSKHKQTSSRHYDIVNGSSALFGKHGHRCNQDNDVHREHRQHYHKSHERDRHRHIGRRSPEEGHSTCRQRSRRSSGDVSPEFVAVKRLRRGSTERRRFPYSRSPRLKHGPANNGPIQVKEHSPFSRTSTSPHSRVVAEVNSRVKSGTDSIGSFSPPLMASPPSPTSSFGNSLFDGQALLELS
uniref:Serine/arginine repetitive matrix protein 2 n=1 Tax=Mesocestoides corti TaxID=53468 RepID=A0A5K3EXF6_MESCO